MITPPQVAGGARVMPYCHESAGWANRSPRGSRPKRSLHAGAGPVSGAEGAGASPVSGPLAGAEGAGCLLDGMEVATAPEV